MTDFQDFFTKSKGKPINYNGQTLFLEHVVKIPDRSIICLSILDHAKDWRQGVNLQTSGYFGIDGSSYPNSIVIWGDTAPADLEIETVSENNALFIRNVWDTGDGVIHSWHGGAAMKVDVGPSSATYYCNDGRLNDDLNDLIFRISRGN